MMNTSQKLIALLSGAALLSVSSLAAQTATTAPVGYVTTTTPTGDDTQIGVPLAQAAALSGVADSVSDAVVTVSATLVANAYDNTHYVLATSGANAGQWSEVVATAVNSITTAEVLLASTDTFVVIPFWTLATAFPGGAGIAASANPSIPSSLILVNDLTAAGINLAPTGAYLYFAGPSPAPGFYSTTFTPSDDVRLTPETFVTIRNQSGSSIDSTFSGTVATSVVGTTVVGVAGAAQDNLLVNPYPAPITLANSGLTNVVESSPNPSIPLDLVLIYDTSVVGVNQAPTGTYLHYAGPSPAAGWYSTTFQASDNVEIPAGGAFIVRKGSGNDETLAWNPTLPYTL